jgi:hypothetical protein
MKADEIDAEIRITAAQRRLPKTHLERWLAMDDASSGALLALARSLRLRTGQLVSALELLEEIAVRELTTVAEVLGRDELRRIANGPDSAPARASAFVEALRQLRFPRLKKMQELLRAEIAALKLPSRISLVLPKELGSDDLKISFQVRNGGELRRLVAALNRAGAGLERIVEMLGGDVKDEI